MKIEDILALTRAGYTKADIQALTSEQVTAEVTAEAVTSEVAEPEPVKAAEVPAAENDAVSALLAEVQSLKKQLTQHFINTDSMPTVSREDIATSILGEVINPGNKKK